MKWIGGHYIGRIRKSDTIDQAKELVRNGLLIDLKLSFDWKTFSWVFVSETIYDPKTDRFFTRNDWLSYTYRTPYFSSDEERNKWRCHVGGIEIGVDQLQYLIKMPPLVIEKNGAIIHRSLTQLEQAWIANCYRTDEELKMDQAIKFEESPKWADMKLDVDGLIK